MSNVPNQILSVSARQWSVLVPNDIPEEKVRARVDRFKPISVEHIDPRSNYGYWTVRIADPLQSLRNTNVKIQFLNAVLAPSFTH